jgi:hypothetical protein
MTIYNTITDTVFFDLEEIKEVEKLKADYEAEGFKTVDMKPAIDGKKGSIHFVKTQLICQK